MTDKPKAAIDVDVVSDVVCPWCFIGKRNLEAALSQLQDVDVSVQWRPFQLDPTIPPEGKDRRQYMRDKFGSDERSRELHRNVENAGAAAGIDFNFKAIEVSPNTLNAHRLVHWAGGVDNAMQNRIVKRLFESYFLEGINIGDKEVLAGVASEAGMDGAIVRDILAGDQDKETVRQEIGAAQQMGVSGVPCFIIDRRYAVMGAQPPGTLVQAIRQAAAEKAENDQYAAN